MLNQHIPDDLGCKRSPLPRLRKGIKEARRLNRAVQTPPQVLVLTQAPWAAVVVVRIIRVSAVRLRGFSPWW